VSLLRSLSGAPKEERIFVVSRFGKGEEGKLGAGRRREKVFKSSSCKGTGRGMVLSCVVTRERKKMGGGRTEERVVKKVITARGQWPQPLLIDSSRKR